MKNNSRKILVAALFVTAISTFSTSCGNNDSNKKQETTEAPKSMVETPITGAEPTKDQKLAKGKEVFTRVCQVCHQADGKGIANTFPPLAGSDYLAADLNRAIHSAANGLKGEITVNGMKFNQEMPKPNPAFTDEELASVFTYVLNNFGNKSGEVTIAQAASARK